MSVSLIAFVGPYQAVERSSVVVTARFRDRAAMEGETPTNAYWRIDNEDGCQVADWTQASVPAEATEIDIAISPDLNAIMNCTKAYERRTLTVMVDRGLSTQFAAPYQFDLRNLAWRS